MENYIPIIRIQRQVEGILHWKCPDLSEQGRKEAAEEILALIVPALEAGNKAAFELHEIKGEK